MWPVIFICLGGCLLAVGSVWLYDVEHVLNAADEPFQPKTRKPARFGADANKDTVPQKKLALTPSVASLPMAPRQCDEKAVAAAATGGTREVGDATSTDELRNLSNPEVTKRALALEAELRAFEAQCRQEQRAPCAEQEAKSRDKKQSEFRQTLLSRAVSLADELLFRLGRVDVPSDVRSLSIKLGAAVVASRKPAGPQPLVPIANYLVFLAGKLPR